MTVPHTKTVSNREYKRHQASIHNHLVETKGYGAVAARGLIQRMANRRQARNASLLLGKTSRSRPLLPESQAKIESAGRGLDKIHRLLERAK